MDFFRVWTSAVSGTIIFTALCEIIVPDGNIKKYVRLILGMIVTVTLIKPLGSMNIVKTTEEILNYNKALAYSQQENYTEDEKKKITQLYQRKLEEKITESLESKINASISIDVDTESELKEKFGEIKEIYVEVSQDNGFKDYQDEIMEILRKDYGISEDKLRLKFLSG